MRDVGSAEIRKDGGSNLVESHKEWSPDQAYNDTDSESQNDDNVSTDEIAGEQADEGSSVSSHLKSVMK